MFVHYHSYNKTVQSTAMIDKTWLFRCDTKLYGQKLFVFNLTYVPNYFFIPRSELFLNLEKNKAGVRIIVVIIKVYPIFNFLFQIRQWKTVNKVRITKKKGRKYSFLDLVILFDTYCNTGKKVNIG